MRNPKLYLNAGVDFGTSFTKVYIDDQFNVGNRRPVLFGANQSGLFPSYVRIHGDAIHGPNSESQNGITIPYLKLFLADACSQSSEFSSLYQVDLDNVPHPDILTTAYFFHLIESIVEFMGKDHDWNIFDFGRDFLTAQVAVPTGLNEASNALDESILKCLKGAMLMIELGHKEATVTGITNILEQLAQIEGGQAEWLEYSCKKYPEVAASVQAMLQSGELVEGKYITMDVGAGTVDMNFFFKRGDTNTNADEDKSLDNWVARVVPLGCACLETLHDNAQPHERSGLGMSDAELSKRLSEEIKRMMSQVFALQPRRVDGNGPDVFHHGVHAYIMGGGANVDLYVDTLKSALAELDVKVPRINRLPQPTTNFTLPKDVDDFGRLAVAYGTSPAPENLEPTRLPGEMSEVLQEAWQRAIQNRTQTRTDCTCYSNEACPICGGTGTIVENRISANLEAIQIIAPQNEVEPASQTVKATQLTNAEKNLKKLIDQYWCYLREDSFTYGAKHVHIVKQLLVLRKIVEIYLSLPSELKEKWTEDLKELLDKAARQRRRKASFQAGTAALKSDCITANIDCATDFRSQNFKPIKITAAYWERDHIVSKINNANVMTNSVSLMVKIHTPKMDNLDPKLIQLHARIPKNG